MSKPMKSYKYGCKRPKSAGGFARGAVVYRDAASDLLRASVTSSSMNSPMFA
jgi:hypothetical protein